MELPKFTENLNIISSLADRPAMTADELKKSFDEAGNKIKDFLNNKFLPELEKELKKEMEKIETDLGKKVSEADKKKYHVGKLVFSSENINPATYLGFGTWDYVGKGRTLVGYDPSSAIFKAGETGGSDKIKIIKENLPSFDIGTVVTDVTANTSNNADLTFNGTVVTSVGKKTATLKFNGQNKDISFTPKYEVVYIFKRIA